CPPRLPRPHLTTAFATRNATTISRIVPLPKPAYASAGVSKPVSTDAATANTDVVRIGKAFVTTEKIAAAKMANSRQASRLNPSGGGVHHTTAARPQVAMRAAARVMSPLKDAVRSQH